MTEEQKLKTLELFNKAYDAGSEFFKLLEEAFKYGDELGFDQDYWDKLEIEDDRFRTLSDRADDLEIKLEKL